MTGKSHEVGYSTEDLKAGGKATHDSDESAVQSPERFRRLGQADVHLLRPAPRGLP